MTATGADDPHPCRGEHDAADAEEVVKRPGSPDEATVVSEETLTSPKGRQYHILRTNQMDAYDDPPEKETGCGERREPAAEQSGDEADGV